MKILYALIFCLFASLAAFADVVTIRSGDHQDFSRLVFYYPAGARPEIRAGGRGFYVRFDFFVTELNSSSVFYYIDKNRIDGLRLEEGGIFVEVSCFCAVREGFVRPGVFYVDVLDEVSGVQSSILVGGLQGGNRLLKEWGYGFPGVWPDGTSWVESVVSRMFLGRARGVPYIWMSPVFVAGSEKSNVARYNASWEEVGNVSKYSIADGWGFGISGSDAEDCDFNVLESFLDFSFPGGSFSDRLLSVSSGHAEEPDDKYLLRMARFYLSEGMLEEAGIVLMESAGGREAEVLRWIYEFLGLNGETAPDFPPQFSCYPGSDFWIHFSNPDSTHSVESNLSSFVYFRGLPLGLRQVVLNVAGKRKLGVVESIWGLGNDSYRYPDHIFEAVLSSNEELSFPLSTADRAALEGLMHSLGSSVPGVSLSVRLFESLLAQENWVAALDLLNHLGGESNRSLFLSLLNDHLVPRILKAESGAVASLLFSDMKFDYFRDFLSDDNSRLVRHVLDDISDFGSGSDGFRSGPAESR